MHPQFHGRIEKGQFHLNRKQVWSAYLKSLDDGLYYLELHKAKGVPKTNEQLAYYYAVVLPVIYEGIRSFGNENMVIKVGKKFEEVSITLDVCDHLLKERHAPRDEKGNLITKRDMSVDEASEFIDKCIRWAAEMLGIIVPDADQEWWKR